MGFCIGDCKLWVKACLKQMHDRGHYIGLHYHRNNQIIDINEVNKDIKMQADIISRFLGYKVDRFSLHRHLKENTQIGGLIDAYSPGFFSVTDDLEKPLAVKYIADSNNQWRYGLPIKKTFLENRKLQLVIHPSIIMDGGIKVQSIYSAFQKSLEKTMMNLYVP